MAKKQTQNPPADGQTASAYDDLFIQLGLANLPVTDKERMAKQMQENIEGRVMLRILSMLSDEDKKLFDVCKTDADISEFFKAKKIDPGAIAIEEALAFREELIQDASYIAGKLAQA
ncbi:hypothetical protein HZA39_04575 [Candidatus Peregrinibacteria bacterium]|nr:hypothetical protein [Candidatus Peregrinibacteria bacterium]